MKHDLTKRTIEAVIFDLDGTLLDTLQDITNSVNAALKELHLPPRPPDFYRRHIGAGVPLFARRVLPPQLHDPHTTDKFARAVETHYSRHWARTTRPYPGIEQLLQQLDRLAVPKAVLSNKPHQFTQMLVARFLPAHRFEAVQGHLPGLPIKPDPAAALQMAAKLGVAPGRFAFLGDTPTDMQTARSAGMLAIAVLWGFRSAQELHDAGADILLEEPMALLNLF